MSGTAKIMTEYPEVGKLYRVQPWHIVYRPLGFIFPGRKSNWWADDSPVNIVLSIKRDRAIDS